MSLHFLLYYLIAVFFVIAGRSKKMSIYSSIELNSEVEDGMSVDTNDWKQVEHDIAFGLVGVVHLEIPQLARYVLVQNENAENGFINLREVQIYQEESKFS